MAKHIPNDVITSNIFPRLPPKSLLRFKSVCKTWKSQFENPSFIQFHHDFSVKIESNLSLILTCGSSLYLIPNFIDSSAGNRLLTPVKLPPAFAGTTGIKIIGSHNGLICIGAGKTLNNYLVFNPNLPRNPKILPFAQNVCSRTFGGSSTDFCHRRCLMTAGIGFDYISEVYKLVYIFILTTVRDPQPEGMVYNSKTGSWTRLEPPVFVHAPNATVISSDRWIFSGELNNSLHFVGQRDRNVILTFDLYSEEWGEINLPCCELGFEVEKQYYELEQGYGVEEFYQIIDACVLRGCLSVLVIDHGCKHPSFWVWNEYGNDRSWTKLFTLKKLGGSFRVLYYLIDRPVVLLSHESRGVFWYDYEASIVTDKIEIKKGVEISDCRVIFAGSLIPVPGGRPRQGLGRRIEDDKGEDEDDVISSTRPLSSKQRKAEKKRLKKIEMMARNKSRPRETSSTVKARKVRLIYN